MHELEGRSVLVVDDDRSVFMLLGEIVELLGMSCSSALMLETARKMLTEVSERDKQYSYMIVDNRLPDGMGIEFISELINRFQYDPSYILFLSGDVNRSVQERLEGMGVAHMSKPFDSMEMMQWFQDKRVV